MEFPFPQRATTSRSPLHSILSQPYAPTSSRPCVPDLVGPLEVTSDPLSCFFSFRTGSKRSSGRCGGTTARSKSRSSLLRSLVNSSRRRGHSGRRVRPLRTTMSRWRRREGASQGSLGLNTSTRPLTRMRTRRRSTLTSMSAPTVGREASDQSLTFSELYRSSSTAAASSMNSPPQTPQSQAAVEPTFADGLASAQESHQRAQEPSPSSATSDDGRLPSKSGIQTPGRFADPLSQPHPAKLNIRHIVGALSTLDGSGGPVSNRRRGQHPSSKPPALKRRSSLPAPIKVVPRPEGEEGQRDDIHNPTAQRASKSKIPRSSEREQSTAGTASADVSPTPRSSSSRAAAHLTPESYAAAGQTPKPHERMRRHGSPRHHHSRHAGEQVSPGQDAFAVAPGGQGDRAGKSSGRAFAFFGADESESDSGLSGSDDN